MWKEIQKIFNFQALQVLFWNIRSFLSLRLESSISENIKQLFFGVFFFFFNFLSSESYFVKYKRYITLESSIPGYVRNFVILELESSNF